MIKLTKVFISSEVFLMFALKKIRFHYNTFLDDEMQHEI